MDWFNVSPVFHRYVIFFSKKEKKRKKKINNMKRKIWFMFEKWNLKASINCKLNVNNMNSETIYQLIINGSYMWKKKL